MDFRELQYVVTVADCRNITQASKELFISQPSLSHALAQIEKEVVPNFLTAPISR